MRCIEPRKVRVGYSLAPAALTGTATAEVPCGSCINCRIDQERTWRTRLKLEWLMHGQTAWVTLTYDDEHLPDPAHVSKIELVNFIRRFRYNVSTIPIRYFGVGEYGDRSLRPHYHLLLFGADPVLHKPVIDRCWHGTKDKRIGIYAQEANKESIGYITKYISKKTLKDTGLHPSCYGKADEFMISSKKGGGIGRAAVEKLVESIRKQKLDGKRYYTTVNIGGKNHPLGRYLKKHMNEWQKLDYTEKLLRFAWSQEEYAERRFKVEKKRRYEKRSII